MSDANDCLQKMLPDEKQPEMMQQVGAKPNLFLKGCVIHRTKLLMRLLILALIVDRINYLGPLEPAF